MGNLDTLIVQDLFMDKTAEMADVVLPASNAALESEGSVTNSERRVQRVRKASSRLAARGTTSGSSALAPTRRRLGRGHAALGVGRLRRVSPMHAGMTNERLDEGEGIRWPCWDEEHPGTKFLHARLWEQERDKRGPKAPFSVTPFEPPVDELTEEFPLRLTTGRRLDSYTGVQTGGYIVPCGVARRSTCPRRTPLASGSRKVRSSE